MSHLKTFLSEARATSQATALPAILWSARTEKLDSSVSASRLLCAHLQNEEAVRDISQVPAG